MRDYRDRSDDDGPPPALTIACVIGSPCLGKWCEGYITWLRSREVGWASIANYTNSLYSLLTFVATSDEYELTYESGFTCLDMLANLRRQAHGHASTDKMYRKRDANWMVHERSQRLSSPSHHTKRPTQNNSRDLFMAPSPLATGVVRGPGDTHGCDRGV